jgi:large subunit ribosomal protein L15
MQLNSLQRHIPNKKSAAVGRGGKRGKTSGRGTKGQKARAGRKMYPEIRDAIKRIPKLRGRGKNIFQSFQVAYTVVSIADLEQAFKAGEKVTPATLVAKNLVSLYKGVKPRIKILADGDLSKKLIVKGCQVTESAKIKIEKAGGSVPALAPVKAKAVVKETPKPKEKEAKKK